MGVIGVLVGSLVRHDSVTPKVRTDTGGDGRVVATIGLHYWGRRWVQAHNYISHIRRACRARVGVGMRAGLLCDDWH